MAQTPATAGQPPSRREAAAPPASPPRRGRRRVLLWATLVLLLLVAQTLLVVLTVRYESTRLQDAADGVAQDTAAELRSRLLQAVQRLQRVNTGATVVAGADAVAIFADEPALARIEWRNADRRIVATLDAPHGPVLFAHLPRPSLEVDADAACSLARRSAAPVFSRSYFVPLANGQGHEVVDLCMARGLGTPRAESEAGYLVATFVLSRLLEQLLTQRQVREHELSFIEPDGTRLARAGARRGSGTYLGERLVDLPGATLQLRVDAVAGSPSLIPNLAVALVLGLSVALFALVIVLARDVRRRAEAERALAEALAQRRAMEDSLVTGLRARDLDGVITYVNPAFCTMVGFSADELRDSSPPPYWPPERVAEYSQRQALRLHTERGADAREGVESVFVRRSGERFPVMIYEAPLVDGEGRHTGWMSAVVDLSAQRRIEELSRQQQDRLQATARLATVGEMASLLSHELNQPLAAIASYANGSLNLLQAPGDDTREMLQHSLTRIAEQAERAGRVIKSVHDFVRRREHARETLRVDALLDAVLPLVRLQARKSGVRIELDLPAPPAPRVVCDRTMVEQVLLNLTRNGIQAMEGNPPTRERVLTLRVRVVEPRRVEIAVIDRGAGIPPEVAERLFTPFFTTKGEGMGLGLSLCRTVVEQHGGTLAFGPGEPEANSAAAWPPGTAFRFTLAAAVSATAASVEAAAPAALQPHHDPEP